MTTRTLLSALALASAFASTAFADEAPKVAIRSFTYNGPGCPIDPENPVTVKMDGTDMLVTLPNMKAELAPGLPPTAARKTCNLSFSYAIPEGYQIALSSYSLDGSAKIDEGAKGELALTQRFEGGVGSVRRSNFFIGPFDSTFTADHIIDVPSLVWSQCKAKAVMQVNLQNRVTNTDSTQPDAGGTVGLDTLNTNKFTLVLKACR